MNYYLSIQEGGSAQSKKESQVTQVRPFAPKSREDGESERGRLHRVGEEQRRLRGAINNKKKMQLHAMKRITPLQLFSPNMGFDASEFKMQNSELFTKFEE